MASSVLEMIKEEVTCPICLELLKEPMSADCNHSFCRACITLNYESNRNTEGEGNCPVCRVPYPFGNLRPNRHVANIVERLQEFKCIPEEEQKVNICVQHGEKLQLFCKKDMMAICWLCERSQEHHGHQTALIEEVNHEYKEKLQAALQKLMKNEKRCDEWQNDLQQQRADWKNQIQRDIENVQMEFKGLRDFLDSKENEALQELNEEEEDVMEKLKESENELEQQRQWVKDLISDVEHQLELSTMEMLQGVNYILRRCQTLKLKQPQTVPLKRRRRFQAPDLKGLLHAYQGLMDVQKYWVDMTLQAKDNEVIVDKEKRQIEYLSYYKRNLQISETYHLGVLGYPAISSGKHYWEVDVSKSDAWLLGLNDGKCTQPQRHSMGEMTYKMQNISNVKQREMYQPKCGYWIIGKKNTSVYNAFDECSITHNSSVLALSLPGPPSRVGVFLDREACTLSFYDVSNCRSLIYRFYDPAFPPKVYPYFNPMECSKPMTVCGPPS
ncbi:tripartite motif-containing protein 30A-like [Grammomys surdaster]|uniref:tripartite motif-containing protein 30A-like n=1 Tax=Grammomys surdaster TaxID=491861 RepID=UPI00109F540E|nr:tripartite motif-containing protein 30A-like [Grammomys surdaster]XP_028637913.1 tripartite motif-containing protein 30A-like [Grammomys surdaster]